ncbi:MAG TPA: twin-arginine translocase subunit TatC [Rhodocyclaceae bacterium]|nr:twin-arginine translocase subunit TatC [Rhodocyclaceae bacterium]
MSDTQETFISHLIELRARLIRAIVAVVIVFLCLVHWARDIYTLLATPMLAAMPQGGHMVATDVAGAFLVPMKVTMMAAFMIALPYVLFQAWAFIAPGLYAHEKRLVLPLIAASVVLFFVGMSFAYFVVFPTVFGFVNKFAPVGVAVMTDIDKYLSFVMTSFLAFGLTFEVPVIVVVLVRVGIVELAVLKDVRRYVIVGAFVVAAIFTPPDVVSQCMMAIPLIVLYELGLLAAGLVGKPNHGEALEAPEQ